MRHLAQRKIVAMRAKACHHRIGPLADIRMLAERLALVDLTDMQLYHRAVEGMSRV